MALMSVCTSKHRFIVFLLSVLAATLGAATNPISNHAHNPSAWYDRTWTTGAHGGINTDQVVGWSFVDNFPVGDGFRSRVKDGAQEWNELAPAMRFDFQTTDPTFLDWDAPCPTSANQSMYQDNLVGWQEFDVAIAQTRSCRIPGTDSMLWFKMRVDNDRNWYTGTGQPGPSQLDLWSNAAHEFSHASGRTIGGAAGDFPEGSEYCPDPGAPNFANRHTTCELLFRGTRNTRSLEEHDRDVFNAAY